MRRRLNVRLWPFTYERDPVVIREAIRSFEDAIRIERGCVARALKRGDRSRAQGHRRQVDRIAEVRRNGEARLRSLAPHPI